MEHTFNIEKYVKETYCFSELVGFNLIKPEMFSKQVLVHSESTFYLSEGKINEEPLVLLYRLKNGMYILLTRDYKEPSETYKIKLYYKASQSDELFYTVNNLLKLTKK